MRTGAACEGGALPLEADGVKHCPTHGEHLVNCTDYCRQEMPAHSFREAIGRDVVRGLPMGTDFICDGCAHLFPMDQARIRFEAKGPDGRLNFQAEPLTADRWRFVRGFWCIRCVDLPLPIRLLSDETIRDWHRAAELGRLDPRTMRERIMVLCQEILRERALHGETRQTRDVG